MSAIPVADGAGRVGSPTVKALTLAGHDGVGRLDLSAGYPEAAVGGRSTSVREDVR